VAEAYRVLRPGGRALLIGPVRPANRLVRALAEAWMLFPSVDEYRGWFERAGFADVSLAPLAPAWYRSRRAPYAVAVSGRKPAPGPSPAATAAPAERLGAPMAGGERARRLARFALGSAAGAAFIPLALALAARARLQERGAR
jgi:MPBQ/MSBQ methyltransferase